MKNVVIDADGNPEVLNTKHRGTSDYETVDDEGSSKTKKMSPMDRKVAEMKSAMHKPTFSALVTLQVLCRRKVERLRQQKRAREENKRKLEYMKRQSHMSMRGIDSQVL